MAPEAEPEYCSDTATGQCRCGNNRVLPNSGRCGPHNYLETVAENMIFDSALEIDTSDALLGSTTLRKFIAGERFHAISQHWSHGST